MDKKKIIFDFLKSQTLCVVATMERGGQAPESALVAFSETDELELIFGTFFDTRKFANLRQNPNVSLVIGFGDVTVQYEGTAVITASEEEVRCRELHVKKNPRSTKYLHDPKERLIKVAPRWVRYTDYGTEPETVFELRFAS